MAFDIMKFFNFGGRAEAVLEEVHKGVTIAESIGPLLVKAATDGYAAATNPSAKGIMQVLSDIETDMPKIATAFAANNTQVVPSAGGTANVTEHEDPATTTKASQAEPDQMAEPVAQTETEQPVS